MSQATIKKHQRSLFEIRKNGGRTSLHEAQVVSILLTWLLNSKRGANL